MDNKHKYQNITKRLFSYSTSQHCLRLGFFISALHGDVMEKKKRERLHDTQDLQLVT